MQDFTTYRGSASFSHSVSNRAAPCTAMRQWSSSPVLANPWAKLDGPTTEMTGFDPHPLVVEEEGRPPGLVGPIRAAGAR